MKQQGAWKQIGRRICAVVLMAACMLPMAPQTLITPASAVTQAEIDALRQDASKLRAQQKELQKQLKDIAADKGKALEQKELLERQIDATQDEIDNISRQISKYNELIAQKQTELETAEAQERAQYELFCKRVRIMEEGGEVSYWSILFSSDSFSDLLDNALIVEEIMEYDNQIMNQLLAIQKQIEEDKAALEDARRQQEAAKKEQEAARAALKAQQTEVDALIAQINTQEDQIQAAEAQLKRAAAEIDAEVRAAEKELSGQIGNVPSESGFLWPLDNYNTLSSLFGSRTHPITGRPNNHSGIDIPAPRNTPIRAAKSGVVTTSKRHSSYGNYVVVSHSDGTSTLYAHMNRRGVSKGDVVSQGQVIGYVGTTGSSTGNHLHFEVRVNGTRTDPVNYFKSKTLYVTSKGRRTLLQH